MPSGPDNARQGPRPMTFMSPRSMNLVSFRPMSLVSPRPMRLVSPRPVMRLELGRAAMSWFANDGRIGTQDRYLEWALGSGACPYINSYGGNDVSTGIHAASLFGTLGTTETTCVIRRSRSPAMSRKSCHLWIQSRDLLGGKSGNGTGSYWWTADHGADQTLFSAPDDDFCFLRPISDSSGHNG